MEKETQQRARAPGRRMKWLFGVSLALNLAFAGLIAGAFIRHDPTQARGGPQAYARPYMEALERSDRRAIFRALRAERGALFPDRGTRQTMYEDVLSALRAEPFDADALRAAVDRQASTGVQFQQKARMAWLELVAEMSNAERSAYAAGVQEALSHRSKRK